MSLFPSKLGFGVSGALGTPLVSQSQTSRLIESAYEGGIRVFDTAPAYGAGMAERRLGRALHRLKIKDSFVITKAGLMSSGLAKRVRNFDPRAIENSIMSSLERLGLEGVNALSLHGPAPSELSKELFDRLKALRSAGAFSYLGITGRGEELEAGLALGPSIL